MSAVGALQPVAVPFSEVDVNLKTAARRLGVHYQTAYRWVRSGQLVAVKVGAGYEVSDAALARFQAQRVALERPPESASSQLRVATAPVPESPTTRQAALAVLDRMLDVVTLDAGPVVERTVRLAADVLGDAAILTLQGDDGELDIAHVGHADPVVEVTVASVARDVPFTKEFARSVLRRGRTVHVPQVPQREVRQRMRPELHEHLISGGCFSLVCAPLGIDEHLVGTLLVVRDAPGMPYTHDDVEFVEALAARVALAHARSSLFRAAWITRRHVVDTVVGAAADHEPIDALPRSTVDELLEWAVAEDSAALVAILDVDLRHLACTKAYAEMLGSDATRVRGVRLGALIADTDPLDAALEAVLVDELDFRTVELRPTGGSPIRLQVAMIRRSDATPWCIVTVAHLVPQAADLARSSA